MVDFTEQGAKGKARLDDFERALFQLAIIRKKAVNLDAQNYRKEKAERSINIFEFLNSRGMGEQTFSDLEDEVRKQLQSSQTKQIPPPKPETILNIEPGDTDILDIPNVPPELLEEKVNQAHNKGQPLTRYKDLKQIGKGGMGAVFRAYDTQLGRNVALKVVLASDDDANKRFEREAHVTAELDHPNIITVYELGDIHGKKYYAMKFVSSGKGLDAVRKEVLSGKGAYTENDLLRIVKSICNAMAYAQKNGVIHRDLKPANVMLDEGDQVYVMDWGLAKKIRDTDESDPVLNSSIVPDIDGNAEPTLSTVQLTQNGVTVGTPMYMAPEQAEPGRKVAAGKRVKITNTDHRSDIYSVGAIMYELLVKTPFRKGNMNNMMVAAANNTIIQPRKLNPTLSRPLESILLKALHNDPDQRYQTFEELGQDIKRYIDGEQVKEHKYGILERTGRWMKRHTALVASGILTATLLTTGAFGYNILSERARSAEREQEQQSRIAIQAQSDKNEAEAALATNLKEQLAKAQKRNKAQEKVFAGKRHLDRGSLNKAIAKFSEAIQDDNTYGEAFYLRGVAQYQKLDAEAAVPDFETANKLCKKETVTTDNRALFGAAMAKIDISEDIKGAVEFCRQAVEGSKQQDEYLSLHKSLIEFEKQRSKPLKEQDFTGAVRNAEDALTLDDKMIEAMYLLSMYRSEGILQSFNEKGLRPFRDYKKALEYITKALDVTPNNIRVLTHSARLNAALGNNEKAIEQADKLLTMKKDVQDFYSFKAIALHNLQKYKECIDVIDTAEKYCELSYLNLSVRGVAYYNLKQPEKALEDITASLKIRKTAPGYMYRALSLLELNRPEEALDDSNQSLKLNPEYPSAYLTRGRSQQQLGKLDEARQDYDAATKYGNPQGLLLAGKLCAQQKKETDAAKYFEQYLKTNAQEERDYVTKWLQERKQ